jgi:hypothetical protein
VCADWLEKLFFYVLMSFLQVLDDKNSCVGSKFSPPFGCDYRLTYRAWIEVKRLLIAGLDIFGLNFRLKNK